MLSSVSSHNVKKKRSKNTCPWLADEKSKGLCMACKLHQRELKLPLLSHFLLHFFAAQMMTPISLTLHAPPPHVFILSAPQTSDAIYLFLHVKILHCLPSIAVAVTLSFTQAPLSRHMHLPMPVITLCSVQRPSTCTH